MFGDSPNDLLNNLNEEHPLVVAVEYISKEESADVAAGSASAKHGVTGILAVQGAFAEHAAMLDRLGAPWKLLRAAEDFDDSIDRVILPGGESTTQGKLLRSTGLFEPIAEHIAAGKPVFGTCAGMILQPASSITTTTSTSARLTPSCGATHTAASLARSPPPPISAPLPVIPPSWSHRASMFRRTPRPPSCSKISRWCSSVDGNVVGLRQGKILATAFHPELTDDTRIHELFLSL